MWAIGSRFLEIRKNSTKFREQKDKSPAPSQHSPTHFKVTTRKLQELSWEVLSHLPYLLDLSSNDYIMPQKQTHQLSLDLLDKNIKI